jgi:hypothetical protein
MSNKVIQTEVHDKDGNLLRIEVTECDTGNHVMDMLWDPRDEQTQENREDFRKWANRIIRSKDLVSVN